MTVTPIQALTYSRGSMPFSQPSMEESGLIGWSVSWISMIRSTRKRVVEYQAGRLQCEGTNNPIESPENRRNHTIIYIKWQEKAIGGHCGMYYLYREPEIPAFETRELAAMTSSPFRLLYTHYSTKNRRLLPQIVQEMRSETIFASPQKFIYLIREGDHIDRSREDR